MSQLFQPLQNPVPDVKLPACAFYVNQKEFIDASGAYHPPYEGLAWNAAMAPFDADFQTCLTPAALAAAQPYLDSWKESGHETKWNDASDVNRYQYAPIFHVGTDMYQNKNATWAMENPGGGGTIMPQPYSFVNMPSQQPFQSLIPTKTSTPSSARPSALIVAGGVILLLFLGERLI